MTTGVKVALGIGVVAAGGAIYWAYRSRQSMLAAQGVVPPAPMGINSIYSLAGAAASAMGMRMSSAQMVGQAPLQIEYQGVSSAQPLGGTAASASFAAAAAAAAGAMVATAAPIAPSIGPTVEARRGAGHF